MHRELLGIISVDFTIIFTATDLTLCINQALQINCECNGMEDY